MRITPWTIAVAALLITGCEGSKKSGGEAASSPNQAKDTPAAMPAGDDVEAADGTEKPPPPKEAFDGHTRLFNGLVARDGKPTTVDVWARAGSNHGPVELAKGIEVGQASDWFATPKGQKLVIVEAGKGLSSENVAHMVSPEDDDHITAILFIERDGESARAGKLWEAGNSKQQPPQPPAGKGLVVLRADAIRAHEKTLDAKQWAFRVGDGEGACIEQMDGKKSLLGGAKSVHLPLDPGQHKLTLHDRGDRGCSKDPLFTFEVEAVADQGVLVAIYTPDGKKLAASSLAMAIGGNE